jgi:hypothetical protein
MDAHHDKLSQGAKPDIAELLKMQDLSDSEVAATVRKTIIDVLRAIAGSSLSKYQVRMETMRISLLAQHNKVQSLIAAKTAKPCPATFANTNESENPRVVTQDGQLHLYLPQWIVDYADSDAEKKKASELLAHFRCP